MQFIICVDKHLKQFYSYNHMVCLFQEHNKEKFIKELLEVNQNNMENNKHIELVPLLIEPAMLCYILFLGDHWLIIALSSLNILG